MLLLSHPLSGGSCVSVFQQLPGCLAECAARLRPGASTDWNVCSILRTSLEMGPACPWLGQCFAGCLPVFLLYKGKAALGFCLSAQSQRSWQGPWGSSGGMDRLPPTAPVGILLGGAPGQLQNKAGGGVVWCRCQNVRGYVTLLKNKG